MKHKFVILLIAGAVLAGASYAAYRFGMREGMQQPASAAPTAVSRSANESSTGRRILYWHDPMVPGRRFDKPGRSPFMDMQLVPVYAGDTQNDSAEGAGVTISSRAQQNLGVRTAEVVMGTLAPDIQAVGSVAWNERDAAVVPARATGYVEKLFVRAALDPVAKGQPLAELYVPDWVAAQEEFLLTRRLAGTGDASRLGAPGAISIAGGLVDAARQRMRIAGMSDEQIARFEAGGVVQSRVTVIAPIAGVLAEISVREGSAVATGSPIARINGLSTVWVNAELPEALAAQVRAGNAVEVRISSGVVIRGKVGAVLPEINPTTRTLKVRVELANAGRQLVPGMFVTLQIKPPAGNAALLIPTEALITTGTRAVVMVVQDNGSFMPVEVEPGAESAGNTEIRRGLRLGQRVVLSGQFLLDSEASLKGVETRMGGGVESGSGLKVHKGQGVVVSADGKSALIRHGDIPSAGMGAMTMEFIAPRSAMPDRLRPGDRVDFSFTMSRSGELVLTTIKRIPEASGRDESTGEMKGMKP